MNLDWSEQRHNTKIKNTVFKIHNNTNTNVNHVSLLLQNINALFI